MHIVTGGGTGIGRAIALALHARGKRVLATGRRRGPLDELAAASGGGIAVLPCDNSAPADVRKLAETVDAPVTGLVHCAGGNPAITRPHPTSLEDEKALLDETIAGNLTSSALTVNALRPQMSAGASIVLFGSIAAEHGVGYYGPAKAAVASYAVGLAADLGPQDIRVNCVSSGYIADTEFFSGTLSAERAEQLRQQTAIGRTGTPDDAVALALFLLSPEARHITGQNLHLNGGAFTTR
ncbi:SDR family oxidoreductase [Saccharopolyspora sp. NPDC000359]|uniref:SDR family NAD(P)-dependent oxidoreductase n=1 Tax=Saccharopolyspora sp. NPDC000359 TaxID=3154251 RepID=UPI003321D515